MIRNEKLRQNEQDFLYLLACGVSGVCPELSKVQQMDLEKIYVLGKFHTLPAILYMTLEQAGVFSEDSSWMQSPETRALSLKWKDKKDKAIRKVLLLDAERENICKFMEQSGIWYMPLKGIVLKEYYPKLGMRQMADNDILYDAAAQMKMKDYMSGRGYKAVSVGKGNHDVYEKPPIYNYELHTALYGKAHDKAWVEYYDNVKEHLLLTEGYAYGYHFTDEDFYVYIMTHAYKHFDGGGTGVRSLLDIYAYLQKKTHTLNWTYIQEELTKLQIDEFERNSRKLCQKLFSMEEYKLTEEELSLLQYFLGSGTYGTTKNRIQKKLKEYQSDGKVIKPETKRRYLKDRLFPNDEWFKEYVPVVYRHPWMRPFFLVFRLLRGVLRNGKHILKEVQLVVNISDKK